MLLLAPLLLVPPAVAQAISTTMPVPPLQWLNVTGLIQGTSAPPLKYPSIGYDDTSRTLLLFGGESSSGIPTSQTFLSVLLPFSPSQPHLLRQHRFQQQRMVPSQPPGKSAHDSPSRQIHGPQWRRLLLQLVRLPLLSRSSRSSPLQSPCPSSPRWKGPQ